MAEVENKWSNELTQSLVISLPKHVNLKLCKKYRIISLISHPRIILNRLVIKGFNSDEGLLQVIQELYGNAGGAVILNGQMDDFLGYKLASVRVCFLPYPV
ncbi:hypothetical protein DPMN_083859 [Dreissena polymorpha]|uniref:Uncharacterized protein n=1 Tax=Dreissena polymorpha TaxID=45954 RepID=A0A9D3YDS7_DREPO|nr:hypothetical protein DPMN_083859 [Dreissena polymorpha]